VTGKPVDELMTQKVLGPLGLDNTVNNATAVIPEPALHSFSSERRELFGVPADQPFYEESTFWNPSWTITRGAVQTTNIHDMAASMGPSVRAPCSRRPPMRRRCPPACAVSARRRRAAPASH